MLVGGIHAGAEMNTIALMDELVAHFRGAPELILPGLALVIIPVLNPDGLMLGRVNQGRFNGNNVDLNRNWDCDWQPLAYFKQNEVNPGAKPFSEPESAALAALIYDLRPAAVLFYHAAANGIFPGSCGGNHAHTLATVLGDATGYPYGAGFNAYPITGAAANWIDSLGIPAVDVELPDTKQTEFSRNLRGVIAVQCHLVGEEAAAIFTLCNE